MGFVHVAVHGVTGGRRVTAADGGEHKLVLLHRGTPGRHGLKMTAQSLKYRAMARIPKSLHGLHQHAIAAGLHDGGVKGAVAGQRDHALLGILRHAVNGLAHGGNVAPLGLNRGHRGGFSLDHTPSSDQLQGPPFGRQWIGWCGAWVHSTITHINTGARADLNPALHLQRDQGFAYRGTAHTQLLGQVPLGRQARARGKFALSHAQTQLFRDLAVQALGLDGWQRHGGGAYRVNMDGTGGQTNL
jgi:hypothetical protein